MTEAEDETIEVEKSKENDKVSGKSEAEKSINTDALASVRLTRLLA